jgi:MFS family permease
LASVAWFDILARAIPLRRRGRMMGVGQVLIGLSGMGAGAVVSLVLGNPAISFPHDYAILFTIGCGIFVLSALALSLVREPPPDLADADAGAGLQGRWWAQVLGDPLFRRFSICRIFVAMVTLATPFYVLHARDVLLLPARVIGGFVSAQMLGGVLAGAVLGPVCERWGPRYVVRVGSAAAALAPLLAFLIHMVGGPLVRFYPLIYLLLGVLNSTWTLGFMNYLLEIAPPGMNSAYIGLGNTISGLMMIVPPLGGALLELTSYPVLFGLTATLVGTGLVLAMTLHPSTMPSAGDEAA